MRPRTETVSRYVRNAELARYIGVSAMTIYRWKRDPGLETPPAAKINGIEHNDVDAWDAWFRARAVSHVQRVR